MGELIKVDFTASAAAERVEGLPGEVVHVLFGEVDRLEQQIGKLGELPHPSDYELGDVTLHSDGRVVRVVERDIDEGGEPCWVTHGYFDYEQLRKYLFDRRATRNRLERKAARAVCRHDYDARRRCRRCGALKPRKYRLCSSRPRTWTRQGSRYESSPTCRRRRGHDGACSWADDPGCHDPVQCRRGAGD